jgi:hypothetical protein
MTHASFDVITTESKLSFVKDAMLRLCLKIDLSVAEKAVADNAIHANAVALNDMFEFDNRKISASLIG